MSACQNNDVSDVTAPRVYQDGRSRFQWSHHMTAASLTDDGYYEYCAGYCS